MSRGALWSRNMNCGPDLLPSEKDSFQDVRTYLRRLQIVEPVAFLWGKKPTLSLSDHDILPKLQGNAGGRRELSAPGVRSVAPICYQTGRICSNMSTPCLSAFLMKPRGQELAHAQGLRHSFQNLCWAKLLDRKAAYCVTTRAKGDRKTARAVRPGKTES